MTRAATDTIAGPQRPGGQGLDLQQHESGDRAIHLLLTSEDGRRWTDFVATFRDDADGGAYEVWAERGMIRFRRYLTAEGTHRYEVVEQVGANPIENQDPALLATIDAELAAAGASDVASAFIEPSEVSYPYAYERLAALFDSPNAPDLVVNPRSYAYGRQPGQHGALDVVQSRSPLIFAGPGVRSGHTATGAARQIDVAPTVAALCGFPLIDGRDATGRTSSERGVAPDVYLRRQDGAVLDEVVDPEGGTAERLVIFLLDGLSNSELRYRLEQDSAAIPNIRALVERGTIFATGSTTNFPSITWPSHNAIGTGAWCGHHDIVNPTYYLRAERETVSPQGQQFETARFLNHDVETLFEAFHRVKGAYDPATKTGALTASINEPCTRGADHANLEYRMLVDRERLKAVTAETLPEVVDYIPHFGQNSHGMTGIIDNRALGQVRALLLDDTLPTPAMMFIELTSTDSVGHEVGPHHELLRSCLDETDRRIGQILELLAQRGDLDSTLFVLTTDHGMALQRTEWAANPARIPERDGMAAVTTEPLIYLRDLRVAIEVRADGRTATVIVLDNDPDPNGEYLPVEGALLLVTDHEDGKVAEVHTDAHGNAGFAIPADVEPHQIALSVDAHGFNRRHLRLDGERLGIDLREVLYGGGVA
jgi:arylsulfatase A-like enzyme